MNISTSENIIWHGTYWLNDDFNCDRESYIALDVSIFDILIEYINKNGSFRSDKNTYYTHETLDHSGVEHVFINNENNYVNMADNLVNLAKEKGGRDNITVLLFGGEKI